MTQDKYDQKSAVLDAAFSLAFMLIIWCCGAVVGMLLTSFL